MQWEPVRKWLYRLSPCVWGSLFCLYAIIHSWATLSSTKGWSMIGIIILVPVLLILAACSLLLKQLIPPKRTGLLWLVEAMLLIAIFLYIDWYYL